MFVSSHLMSEMALTAEHLIVIGRGRLIADAPVRKFIDEAAEDRTGAVTDAAKLRELLAAPRLPRTPSTAPLR